MSSPHVYDQLKGYLALEFNGVYQVLDFDQIEPTLSQGTTSFLALEELLGEDALVSFGDSNNLMSQESGSILVHCFAPAPESSNTVRTIIQSVIQIIRHLEIAGIRIVGITPPDLETLNDGLWSVGATTMLYEYETFNARQTGD